MQKITPHLWFDKEAKEAAELYTSVFEGSEITSVVTLRDTPSGDCDVVSFVLAGQPFQAISAGPLFTFNPSISFMVACRSKDEVDTLWRHLIKGGSDVMPLDTYPFSERYGWLEDRFGLSWQIGFFPDAPQKITPSLMFVGDVCGKAEETIKFYASTFRNAQVGDIFRYDLDTDEVLNLTNDEFAAYASVYSPCAMSLMYSGTSVCAGQAHWQSTTLW